VVSTTAFGIAEQAFIVLELLELVLARLNLLNLVVDGAASATVLRRNFRHRCKEARQNLFLIA
jgi:hypothetical protein